MIIIIGGGIVGAAIAYYLSSASLNNIILIEKEKLLGTAVTQYCSGGVRHQFTTEINCKFSIESMKKINALAKEIDYKKYGYLILDMKEGMSVPRVKMQNSLGIRSEALSVKQIKERFPFLNLKGVKSGSFFAEDGVADPAALLAYYEKGAKANGVKFLNETTVLSITKKEGKITGIKTDKGYFQSETVILSAGVQSRELGATIGIDIPIVHKRKYILVQQ